MEFLDFFNKNIIPICLFLTLPFLYFIYKYSKRITKIPDLPRKYENFVFYGHVISVGDGDGFKVIHTPFLNFRKAWLKEDALSIRLAAIDAPEVKCFGRPGQPFAQESKIILSKLIILKRVKIKVLNIDRYGRIVAMVFIKSRLFFWKNVNLELVKLGMASVFRSNYTSFGGMENKFNQEEAKAKKKKIGIWSDPKFISPQEYKKGVR